MTAVCDQCQTEVPTGFRFCGECGSQIRTKICPECKTGIPITAHKCPHCREDQSMLRNTLLNLSKLAFFAWIGWILWMIVEAR